MNNITPSELITSNLIGLITSISAYYSEYNRNKYYAYAMYLEEHGYNINAQDDEPLKAYLTGYSNIAPESMPEFIAVYVTEYWECISPTNRLSPLQQKTNSLQKKKLDDEFDAEFDVLLKEHELTDPTAIVCCAIAHNDMKLLNYARRKGYVEPLAMTPVVQSIIKLNHIVATTTSHKV